MHICRLNVDFIQEMIKNTYVVGGQHSTPVAQFVLSYLELWFERYVSMRNNLNERVWNPIKKYVHDPKSDPRNSSYHPLSNSLYSSFLSLSLFLSFSLSLSHLEKFRENGFENFVWVSKMKRCWGLWGVRWSLINWMMTLHISEREKKKSPPDWVVESSDNKNREERTHTNT